MTRLSPMASPKALAIPAGTNWLYTGAEGPPLLTQAAAFERYLANRSMAEAGREAHAVVEQRLRERLASMLSLPCEDVALISNASEGMNLVAGSLDLVSGDNVVLNDVEFPSVVQPWLRLAPHGVEPRIARHSGSSLPATSLIDLIDDHTKALVLSHVSYQTGWRHDLDALSDAATRVGAVVVLDATQSLGVVPVPTELVDVVMASSYKWLLGGHGLGVLAWNQRRRPLPLPPAVGWRSVQDVFSDDRFERYHLRADARRFELGFPSYPTIYQLDDSLAWLSRFDVKEIEEHVLTLGGNLIEGLTERGWNLLTPNTAKNRAGNIAVSAPNGAELAAVLTQRRIHCWGGDGRLRASVHLFNGDDDVDELLEALDDLPSHLRPAEWRD